MNKSVLLALFVALAVAVCAEDVFGNTAAASETKTSASPSAIDILQGMRVKRGYGHGGGGGGGHGPGKGGGAAGPVYICGYIGSKEGYGGYGR